MSTTLSRIHIRCQVACLQPAQAGRGGVMSFRNGTFYSIVKLVECVYITEHAAVTAARGSQNVLRYTLMCVLQQQTLA